MDPIDDIFHIFEELVIGVRLPSTIRWRPRTDIYLTPLVIEIELPGVKKEDISVSLSRRRLFIEGIRHRQPRTREGISFYNLESDYGLFEKRIDFPCDVDPNEMKANFDSGVLIIELKRDVPTEYEIPIEEG